MQLGRAALNVSTLVGGVEKRAEFTIEVTDEKIDSATATIGREELFVEESAELVATNTLDSGRVIGNASVETVFQSLTPEIASVTGNTICALKPGTARVKITSTFNGDTVTGTLEIPVLDESFNSISITAGGSKVIKLVGETYPMYVTPYTNKGNELDGSDAVCTYTAKNPDIASVDYNTPQDGKCRL